MRYKGREIHPYESFYWNTTQEFFSGQLGGGISRTVKTDDSLAVMEASIIDDTFGFEAEPRMYNDVAPTLRSERSGLKVLEPSYNNEISPICCQSLRIGNIYPDTDGFKNRTSGRVNSAEGLSPTLRTVTGGHNEPKVVEDWQTVLGSKQHNSYIGSTEECSSCITSACGAGGGMTPMLTDAPL